jgi:hypothetical protein
LALGLAGVVLAAPASAQGSTERASVTASAAQATGDSDQVSVSGDGRFIAFRSSASNLVAGDTNGVSDVFVRDRFTGAVERVSVSDAGVQGDGASAEPNISFDGRYVVFASEANNLATDVPAGGSKDVFLRDRTLGTTRTVTRGANGQASSGDCHRPRLSSDGRYVIFEGSATNLTAPQSSGYQVFRRDMTGGTDLVSVALSGGSGSGFSWSGGISAEGRVVSFVSSSTNLVASDTNGQSDCFYRDMQTGVTRRASISSSGAQSNGNTFTGSSLSRNGRWVAFCSSASNLAPGEFAAAYDIFLHDTQQLQTFRISVNTAGIAANQSSYDPAVSDDGRFVAFQSFSSNLDVLDTDRESDIFLRDRTANTTRLMSRGATFGSNDDSFVPAISADGDVVVFHSESSDLVPQDTNARVDAFARDVGSDNHTSFCNGTVALCPCANAGQGAAGCENSALTGGALLRAFGRASLGADQVTLLANGLPGQTSAFFFQGQLRENAGLGAPFGDGLRCAGGPIVRLSQYGVVSGTAATGYGGSDGLGNGSTVPIHVQGNVTGPGTRTYQVWYRNSATYCTSATHNLSNGVEITWTF